MEKRDVVQIGLIGLKDCDGTYGPAIPLYVPASTEFVEAEKKMINEWLKEKAKYVKEQLDKEDAKKLAKGVNA